MSSESTQAHVLPETAEILSLLRQLDVHPRTLPETHEILSLLHQLHGSAPFAAPATPSTPEATAVSLTPPPAPASPLPTASGLSFDSFFDAEPEAAPGPAPDAAPQGQETTAQPLSLDLPVRAFFDAVSWDSPGRVERIAWDRSTVSTAPAPEQTPPSVQGTMTLDLSVRAFFDAVPWDGASQKRMAPSRPAPTSASQPEPEDEYPLVVTNAAVPGQTQELMDLSVRTFFTRVDWDRRSDSSPQSGETASTHPEVAVEIG